VLLAALALSSLGCMRQSQPKGDLLGAYAVSGALTENSCGQTGLPTANPLAFVAELRDVEGITTWQVEKRPAYSGVLESDGDYRFVSEQVLAMGQQLAPRQNLDPSDFDSLDPDFDLERRNCVLLIKESMSGRLNRMLDADGGVTAGSADGGATVDLSGDNTIEVAAAADTNCSAVLAANGGGFLTLPCFAHYSLEGTLVLPEP
jgi:hypothetical protein